MYYNISQQEINQRNTYTLLFSATLIKSSHKLREYETAFIIKEHVMV